MMIQSSWNLKQRISCYVQLSLTTAFLQLLVMAQGTTANSFQEALSKAEASAVQKEWLVASESWNEVVEANPYVGEFWRQLGVVRYNNKEYRGAIQAYQKAIELGVSPAVMAYDIAGVYGILGEKQQALDWLGRSLNLGFARRQRALTSDNLKLLRDDPKFIAMVGGEDVSKMSRTEGWRYDLELYLGDLKRMHPNPYRKTPREVFEDYANKLRNDIPKLNDEQAAVGFMKLAALAGDGHTVLRPAFLTARGRSAIPLGFYTFEEGIFILGATQKYKDLIGAQLLKIGDLSMDEVISACTPYISRDNAMYLKLEIISLIRSPQFLYGVGVIPDSNKMSLKVRNLDGTEHSVVVEGETSAPASGIDLHGLIPGPAAISLQPRGGNYWFEYLAKEKTVYFQYNQVRNDDKETLPKFLERLFKFIREHEVEKLAIDLRGNSGGDGRLNIPLLLELVRADSINQPGKLFILIGRETFSAAMSLCGLLEKNTQALFVGEPTGSSLNAIGEYNALTLPYSKVSGSVASVGGGNSLDARIWIAPRFFAPQTFAAYKEKRDPALEVVLTFNHRFVAR
jgi:tetratricopeptide (TPR) repeat protein